MTIEHGGGGDGEPDTGRAELASAVRLLLDRSIHCPADAERLRRATGLIEAANRVLGEPLRRQGYRWHTPKTELDEPWDPGQQLTSHLVYGPEHPFAPELVSVRVDGSSLTGTARYGQVYEGPLGLVHGGVIAAIFDGLQATVASLSGNGGALTHTLTIRYRSGTPIDTDLGLFATIDRANGRKVFTRSTISAGGSITAESTGFFICR